MCAPREKSPQENQQSMSAKNRHGPVGHNNSHAPVVDCVDVVATRLDLTCHGNHTFMVDICLLWVLIKGLATKILFFSIVIHPQGC
jgi:hypothetical protein